MIIYVLSLIVALIVIYFFTSKKRSPIPYFPSNKQDLPLILKALNLRSGQTVIDLGAGDGIVVFEAAKQTQKLGYNTQFIAVEINPILILILFLRRIFNPNKKNIKVIYADMFKFDLNVILKGLKDPISSQILRSAQNDVTVFLYISPWFMEKVYKKLKEDLKSFELVSYFYPLKNKKPTKSAMGKNKIFIY